MMLVPTEFDADGVRKKLKKACERAGGQMNWARAADLSTAYVSDVILGKRDPSDRILAALSLIKVVTYREVFH
jgi:DNA-binding transcriptional regulator YdaS (Cro superfamily)